MAKVTRVGNLTKDPELQFTPEGIPVAHTSIAYNPWNSQTKTQGDPIFYDLTIWRDLGEHVCKSLSRGMRVIVTGEGSTEEYEGKTYRKINVDAIGPELRFATCEVTKIAKKVEEPVTKKTTKKTTKAKQLEMEDEEEPF